MSRAHIPQIDYPSASPDVQAAHEHEVAVRGHVTNMKRTLLHSPLAYHAYMQWYVLWEELKRQLGLKAAIVFAHSISSTNQCLLCTTFFRRAISNLGFSPDTFTFEGDEVLLSEFGQALARHQQPVPESLWQAVRARFDTAQQVNLVAFAGLMVATNLFNNAVQVDVDDELEQYLPAEALRREYAAE